MVRVAHEVAPGSLSKFQLFDADDDKGKPHYAWVKAHELAFEQAKMLFDYGASISQEVFFSVFGPKYVDWCEKIGVKRYKLASAIREQIFQAVSETRKPLILSTQRETGDRRLNAKWLYCPAGYPPTAYEMPNYELDWWTWEARGTSADPADFDGFSDHTIGLDAAKIALARGAQIVECHFVLEHNPAFPDDAWSKTPTEIAELDRWEKVCEEVLG